ncbi:MAG: hypothetical protein ACYTEX_27555 [Planctomycetota bacterium]|jgi:hypothetical protein
MRVTMELSHNTIWMRQGTGGFLGLRREPGLGRWWSEGHHVWLQSFHDRPRLDPDGCLARIRLRGVIASHVSSGSERPARAMDRWHWLAKKGDPGLLCSEVPVSRIWKYLKTRGSRAPRPGGSQWLRAFNQWLIDQWRLRDLDVRSHED